MESFRPLQASLVRDTTSLDPLLSEYDALMRAATDLIDHYMGLKRRNRDIKPIKARWCGAASSVRCCSDGCGCGLLPRSLSIACREPSIAPRKGGCWPKLPLPVWCRQRPTSPQPHQSC